MSTLGEFGFGSISGSTTSLKNADFCACCLSSQVPLLSLLSCKHLGFFTSIPNFVINNKIKYVCIICHSMISKFTQFRQQVTESFQRLSSQAVNLKTLKRTPHLQRSVTKVSSTMDCEATSSTLQIEFIREPHTLDCEYENGTDILDSMKEELVDSDIEEVVNDDRINLRKGLKRRVLKGTYRDDREQTDQPSNQTHHHSTPMVTDSHFETVFTNDNSARNEDNIHTNGSATKTILNNQQLLLEITNMILENQKTMMNKFDTFPDVGDPFSSLHHYDTTATTTPGNNYVIKLIKDIKDLDELEALVKDSDYRQKVIKQYASFCNGGIGLGTNCAYRFLDLLFDRKFLCLCSWAGGSRGEGVKYPLKYYKHTIQFFSEMVRQWDHSFTLEDTENFLKNCVKNSMKRSESKRMRMSTKKHRQNRLEHEKTRRLIEAIRAGGNIEDDTDNGNEEEEEAPSGS